MNDSALSIVTKALQPTYGRGDTGSARGSWTQQPLTSSADGNPANVNSQLPPAFGNESANVAAAERQAIDLARTQSVSPTDRAEQAANENAEETPPLAAPGKGELDKAVEAINDFLQQSKRALEFSVDENSGRTIIKVMDSDREKVIRQIPPETALELMQKLRDGDGMAATGLAEKA